MLELSAMFVVALLPIIWLVIALCGLRMQAHVASLGALAVAAACSMLGWGMAPVNVATAALEGFAMAMWPIVIVIVAAVFTYNVTVHTGAIEVIKHMLCSVSADRRVLALLIGWCFGAFLEGMAGFGTAVAIPASMLVALGVAPVTSVLACLVANGAPTMFGSIGIPTTTLATITGIAPNELAFTQAIQVLPFNLACPIIMVTIVGGGVRALRGALPIALVAGLSFAVPQVLAARLIGPALADVVAAVCSLGLTFAFALRAHGAEVPAEHLLVGGLPSENERETLADDLRAWSPFALIFVVLLLTSELFPLVHEPLSSVRTVANIYAGDAGATLTFVWLNTPGVLIMLCGVAGALIQGCSPREMAGVFLGTCRQMAKTVVTMLGVLACAKIMGYSGMISSVAAFFVVTLGGLYPLVAPLLGALGTFVTGSGTSSEVLFGTVQQQAAAAIGADETWLVASNSLGTSAGKMLSPQNIAIGCAACDLAGKDGELMGRVAPYAFAYALAMSLLVYAGTLCL